MRQRRQRGGRFAFDHGVCCPLRPRTPRLSRDLVGLPWRRFNRDRQRLFFCRFVCPAGTSVRKARRCLAVFTTSGNSENIFRALVAAKDLKLKTIAFLGRDGGKCAGLAEVELLVGGKVTARIQEGHKFLLHTICELVESSSIRGRSLSSLPTALSRCEVGARRARSEGSSVRQCGIPHLAKYKRDAAEAPCVG